MARPMSYLSGRLRFTVIAILLLAAFALVLSLGRELAGREDIVEDAKHPIWTKYHYEMGGDALPEYDGYIDAPVWPASAAATRPANQSTNVSPPG